MLRTLAHYWPIHVAVVLGAAVATAVLAGALLVGDSVRGSLRDLTLDRLGRIDAALVATRFFREELAAELERPAPDGAPAGPVEPAIVLRGSATHSGGTARASRVAVLGVGERFGRLFPQAPPLDLARKPGQIFPSVVVNETLARELGAAAGDAIVLHLPRPSAVPRETLMGETDPEDLLQRLRVEVTAVVPDRGPGRFGLSPQQQTPCNAFVDLDQLQRALDVGARANALLAALAPAAADEADARLAASVALEDLGLRLRRGAGFVELSSDELVLRPDVDRALDGVAARLDAVVQRVQSYLANRIVLRGRELPYSLVAALDPIAGRPWATLELAGGAAAPAPGPDGILLNTWAAEDLGAAPGDEVELHYFVVGAREELREASAALRVEGVVALRGLGADADLTPDYPGIRDAEDMAGWDPPFPVDLDRIRPKDERYWDDHRATPKAFVSSETGRRLWSTRFGSTTAARLAPRAGGSLDDLERDLRSALLDATSASAFGLRFRAVREDGLRASAGATDFSVLFLSFSFFLIVAAALLAGLLFRLGVERRASEIGLLLAVGHRVRAVRARLVAEGALLAAIGGVLGTVGAVAYARAMMFALRTIWRPAVGSSELFLHVTLPGLALGGSIAVIVVVAATLLAVRRLVRIAPQRLLAGALATLEPPRRRRLTRWLALGALAAALATASVALARGAAASIGLAFATGALLLVAGLAFFAAWCRAPRRRRPVRGLGDMAARNSSWNPARSILAVALVASATFVIVVIAANRNAAEPGLEARDSGSGGFALVAEADVALHQDLGREADRRELGFDDAESAALADAEVFAFRQLPGDDASCLNLYRPEQPRVLGAPEEFLERGGFAFQAHLPLPAGVGDPWRLLDEPAEPGVVPAIADYASAMWILHVGLGQELTLDDERGRPLRLRLVGLLQGSLFRSELLISERDFVEHFPGRTGTSYFLLDLPPGSAPAASAALERALAPFGLDATTTRARIESYKAVENTYMATFQLLGGLGLLLGTVGLGVVLVRNVIERRGELATLRAVGFRRSRLAWMVLLENAFVLIVGIAVGALAALAAAAPNLVTQPVPWRSLLPTLGSVGLVGMLSSVVAVRVALRAPLLPALKTDR